MRHNLPAAALSFLCAFLPLSAAWAQDRAERIVSLGGTVTEIIHALGEGDRIIARDTTSTWPASVTDLPDVGYVRALSPEGVLSVDPDLIIAEDGAGPVETIDVLKQVEIGYVEVPSGHTADAVIAKIEVIGAALGAQDRATDLMAEVQAAFDASVTTPGPDAPRVLFILSTTGGRIMAGGLDTSADGIITMAGGLNVMTDFQGWKQVSDEAIIAAAPEIIVMMDRGDSDHGPADDALFALPAIAATPAGQTRSLVRMDGLLLLGFGPRTPHAVAELRSAFGTLD